MPVLSYAKFRAEIEALYHPPLRRKSTFAKAQTVLQEFGELTTVKRTSDLTPAAIAAWLDAHPGRAPMTHRSYLSTLRAICRLGKVAGWIRVSPFELRAVADWIPDDHDEEDDPPETARHASIAELQALLALLDAEALTGGWEQWRLQALVYAYAHTGLRKCEALGLKVSDLRDGVIRVRSRRRRKLKTRGSARLVGVPEDLAVVLGQWTPRCDSDWLFPGLRKRGPWLHGGPGYRPLDQIKAAGERAGISGLTIQSLRRSIATHARRLGISVEEVQGLLGHASVQTQEWYLEQDADNARALARRIHFRAGPPPSPQPRP